MFAKLFKLLKMDGVTVIEEILYYLSNLITYDNGEHITFFLDCNIIHCLISHLSETSFSSQLILSALNSTNQLIVNGNCIRDDY